MLSKMKQFLTVSILAAIIPQIVTNNATDSPTGCCIDKYIDLANCKQTQCLIVGGHTNRCQVKPLFYFDPRGFEVCLCKTCLPYGTSCHHSAPDSKGMMDLYVVDKKKAEEYFKKKKAECQTAIGHNKSDSYTVMPTINATKNENPEDFHDQPVFMVFVVVVTTLVIDFIISHELTVLSALRATTLQDL